MAEMTLHHLLRIHIPRDREEPCTRDILEYCRRTGCSEVLLFTTSYDSQPSFVGLDDIRSDVERFDRAAARLREAGITVSVNVLQTLGHVYFPRAMDADFPFQRRVYSDGRVSTEGACPLCPNLREWVAAAYRLYARLKPRILFVDDDYRTVMQGLGCFCDRHLERMGAAAGRPVTRPGVVTALKDSRWPADPLRRVFHDVTTEGLCELARIIREAVHEVSPETRVGLMTCRPPSGELGMDIARITVELAGPHRPLVRPQSGMYCEGFLRDMPHFFQETDWLRAIVPTDIEQYPEIENYPYTSYAKSAQCTFVQMATQVLMGFDHLALNVFDMYGSPFADNEALVALLEQRRGFLNALHALIPEGQRPLGIETFVRPKNPLVNRVSADAGDPPVAWLDRKPIAGLLPCLGLPVTHSGPSPWLFLSGDDVLGLDDAELDTLLRRGAVLDAKAAEALALRGQAERIGVRVGDPIPLDDLGFEEFVDPGISPRLHGRSFPLRPLVADGDWRLLKDITGRGRAASVIRNFRRTEVGPALLLTENQSGERFAVLAFAGQGDRHLIENLMRGEQFRETFAWVARRPLPLTMSHGAPYLWTILNRTLDDRLVMGIVNLSTDTYDALPVQVAPDAMPGRIHRLDETGRLEETPLEAEWDSRGRCLLPCRLAPMELAVLIFEGIEWQSP